MAKESAMAKESTERTAMSEGPAHTTSQGGPAKARRGRRGRVLTFAVGTMALEAVAMRLRGYRVGTSIVVRCRDGHLFTTIWIPGASVKSLRFAWWRYQRCPVGKHWSIVTPVKEANLTAAEKRTAAGHKDIRLP
jgi:hypothetical protein